MLFPIAIAPSAPIASKSRGSAALADRPVTALSPIAVKDIGLYALRQPAPPVTRTRLRVLYDLIGDFFQVILPNFFRSRG